MPARQGRRQPQERQRPRERVQPAATVHHRERGGARDAAAWFPSSGRRVRWREQLKAVATSSLPALLAQQRQRSASGSAWRQLSSASCLRRGTRTGPPLLPGPRPRAARARRLARVAGRGEAAAPPQRPRLRQRPVRRPPLYPMPFPGQRREWREHQEQARRPQERRGPVQPRKQTLPELPPEQCVRAPRRQEARGRRLRREAGPDGWTETELPWLLLPGLKGTDQLGDNLEDVAHHTEVGDLEDRRVPVLVDGDDGLGGLHAGPVLDRAGNAQRDVQLR